MKNLPLGRYQKQVLRFAPNDILTYFKENIYETNLCYMGCMPLLGDTECRPQHAVLEVESNGVTLRPLDEAAVMVNGDPIGGEYRLQNGDTIKIGRTTLRLVL